MSYRLMLPVTLAATVISSACANDAQLLYERDQPPQVGVGGDQPPPPLTGGFGGNGGFGAMVIPAGSGGDEPPPPLWCEDPYCECPVGETCFCAPEPMPPEPMPESCHLNCVDGFCTMGCNPGEPCLMECVSGCDLDCPVDGLCDVICVEGCFVRCAPGSVCFVESGPGMTFVECMEGAICECADPNTCICEGPGCPPTMGP